MSDRTDMEERLAYLERAVDDLSGELARQTREVTRLNRVVALLTEREAEREAAGGAIPLADQKPPHW